MTIQEAINVNRLDQIIYDINIYLYVKTIFIFQDSFIGMS